MTLQPGILEAAQIAYLAYGQTTDFKNFQGNPMPAWQELPEKIQEAWGAAVKAVADNVIHFCHTQMPDDLLHEYAERIRHGRN